MKKSFRRCVIIGPKTWEALQELAIEEERSVSDLIREAVTVLIKRKNKRTGSPVEYDPVKDRYEN